MRLFLLPISRTRTLLYCDKIYPKTRALPVASSSVIAPTGTIPSTNAINPSAPKVTAPENEVAKPAGSLREVFFPPKPTNGSSIQESTILDRATDFAAGTWTGWEREEKGWQKKITVLGNSLLRRIPYEEWSLKSLPPLNKKRTEDYEAIAKGVGEDVQSLREKRTVKVLFPQRDAANATGLEEGNILKEIKSLAEGRTELHRRRMIYSLIAAPLTLPFALIPM
jgi:hypothetical protein